MVAAATVAYFCNLMTSKQVTCKKCKKCMWCKSSEPLPTLKEVSCVVLIVQDNCGPASRKSGFTSECAIAKVPRSCALLKVKCPLSR